MSVRAYRVNKIDWEDNPSFNLWHDYKLMAYFETQDMWDGRSDGGGGTIELPIKALKGAIKNAKKLGLDKPHIEAFKKDIAWLKKKGEEFIQYECY